MNRRIALLVAVVALVGLAGIAAAGPVGSVVAQDDAGTADGDAESDGTEPTNETTDLSPGERLSGVIGVQNAEVSGEVESRAFEVGLDRATTDEERAAVVGDRLDRNEQRLAEIEARQQELRERRDAGELSEGAFAARMAETSVRAEQVKRETNRSADVARGLPESVRDDRGLHDDRLDRVRDRAGNASGPEIAAIARGVAGNDVGGPLAQHRRGAPNGTPGGADRPGSPGGPSGDGDSSGTGGAADDRGSNDTRGPADDRGHGPGNVTDDGNATAVHAPASAGPGTDVDERGGTDAADGADGGGVSDAPGDVTGGPGDANGGSNAASGGQSDTERGSGNVSDADRGSASRAVATLRDVAVDRATAGWSTVAGTAASVDARLRKGVDIGSLTGPDA
ncbi:hypothetical protein [Halorubrum sp. DTA46]|uniref:hypothetical protein n=1 Tax=Halorubrum sp. DTA46 TaxID=3402162 RepID=UPI003AAC5C1C